MGEVVRPIIIMMIIFIATLRRLQVGLWDCRPGSCPAEEGKTSEEPRALPRYGKTVGANFQAPWSMVHYCCSIGLMPELLVVCISSNPAPASTGS